MLKKSETIFFNYTKSIQRDIQGEVSPQENFAYQLIIHILSQIHIVNINKLFNKKKNKKCIMFCRKTPSHQGIHLQKRKIHLGSEIFFEVV